MATQEQLDGIRSGMQAIWSAVADGWARNAGYVDTRGQAVTAALLDRTRPGAQDRVLELACGPGGVGLAAARLAGEVVVSDVVPAMAEIAAARARELGLVNVGHRVLDLEAIDEPDASFDVVVCREGLMFAAEPDRALHEIARVLRPGGRMAVAVWGPREDNPWLGLVLDAVSEHVGQPVPPPGMPGPFALSDAAQIEALVRDTGLADVRVEALPVPLRAPSVDEWWSRTVDLAGPLALMVASMESEDADRLRRRAAAAVAPYASGDGLEIPGVTLIASGRASAP
jgi:SAM-dependent methyltransferase